MRRASDFAKFRVAFWKNWLVLIRRPLAILVTLSVAFGIMGATVIIRAIVKHKLGADQNYPLLPLDIIPDKMSDFQVQHFGYSPKKYNATMAIVCKKLKLAPPYGFDSEDELIDFIVAGDVGKRAGIIFKLDTNNQKPILQVTLRIFTKLQWPLAGQLYDTRIGTLHRDLPTGSYFDPGYYNRGFAAVQYAIFTALYGEKIGNTTIMLNRMPVKSSLDDDFYFLLFEFTSMLCLIFLFDVSKSVVVIVEEKESALKEMMLIMGLPNYICWLAYLATFTLKTLMFTIIAVIVWKVPIGSDVACFVETDGSLLFLILIVYAMALTSFAMLLSTLLSSSNQIHVVSLFITMILSFPVSSPTDFRDFGIGMNAAVLALTPSSFGIVMKTVIVYESISVGLRWNNLFVSPGGTAFSAGTLLLAMAAQTVVHILIAVYLEQVLPGDTGTPRKWYFPIEGIFRNTKKYTYDDHRKIKGNKMDCEEPPLPNSVPGVVITKLTKMFENNLRAVNDLTLTLYENEITILLGENGAGKSTIMAILTGMLSPSSGHALFKGHLDLGWDLKAIRQLIGICPQRTALFELLSVQEHFLLYGQLKGLSWKEALREGNRFLLRTGMSDKRSLRPDELPVGMQRILNLGIALSGGVQVVFLDEPTSGVDVASRRQIWTILAEEKKNRTILLATHFMDEADVLGDRLAIVHQGELKCIGSANYLKAKFESSYSMTIALREGANLKAVTDVINSVVPTALLRNQYGREVTFELSPKSVSAFGELFKRLENIGGSIGVQSFGIELPGLEDVFLKVTHELEEPAKLERAIAVTPLRGYGLFFSQFVALVLKRIYYFRRNPLMLFLQVAPLLLFYVYNHFTFDARSYYGAEVPLPLDMYSPYGKKLCFIEASDDAIEAMVFNYQQVVSSACTVKIVPNLTETIFGLDKIGNYEFQWAALMGAKFEKHLVVAKFNNEPLHSIPIALTAVFNALIRTVDVNGPDLLFVNHPLVYFVMRANRNLSALEGIVITAMLSLWVALFSYVYMIERVSGALQLQFISGLHPIFYWVWSFLFDCVVMLSAFLLMAIGGFVLRNVFQFDSNIIVFIVYFAVASLPLMYLLSSIAKNTGSLLIYLMIVGAGGVALSVGQQALVIMGFWKPEMESYFLMLPHFNMHNAWTKIQMRMREEHQGQVRPLIGNVVALLVMGPLLFSLVVLYDMHCFSRILNWRKKVTQVELKGLDADVLAEMKKVDSMRTQVITQMPLVAKHLTKSFGKKLAVKDCTFSVNRGECLGLLGKNGAGKTTIFKMLIGEEPITESGEAFLNGISIRKDLLKCYKKFGYCPQHDAILSSLTGLEWLTIICRIRGIRFEDTDSVLIPLLHELGFSEHANKGMDKLSGGNKRKLSTALALIGDPAVVYLDEPSTGMDPGSKRRAWNVVSKYRERGNSMVLSSHSMDECEALCTRLIIIVDGKMDSIATSYQLKQRYSKTGHMFIQMERNYAQNAELLAKIKRKLAENVKGFAIKEQYHGKLECEFNADEKLSSLYTLMQSLKTDHHIETYGVSNHSSLDTVFLDRVAAAPQSN